MRTSLALAALLAATTALAGCTQQDADRFADAIRSASQPAAETSPAVDVNQARQQLAGLTITPERSGAGYDRDLFPHWVTIDGACDTRETVLAKQGTGVETGADCYPTAGTWTSPYDGATWHRASDVDVDHMIPLKEAWESGAAGWSTDRRTKFANDLLNPQLIVVTDNLNQAKGAQDPDEWTPPLRSFHCTYAAWWIAVKHAWDLTADTTEVAALDQMLDTCGGGS